MPATASQPVLDASALLAFLRTEPGAPVVADAIAGACAISTANLAEVLSTLADRGADPAAVAVQGLVVCASLLMPVPSS